VRAKISLAEVFFFLHGNGARKILDAYDTVNVHRLVGNPKRKV
jgi:hypothetical protein